MQDLLDRLYEIEKRQQELRKEHAETMRAIVTAAGGVTEAAELLGLDPKTVRLRERGTDGVVLVVYRGTHTNKVDTDGRVYGETGEDEESQAQLDADRMWFTIAKDKRDILRAMAYVADGQLVRVREVVDGDWEEDGDKVALPVGPSLSPAELAKKFPTLPFTIGSPRPMVRGKIREYIAL
jgi:hypothetical protein